MFFVKTMFFVCSCEVGTWIRDGHHNVAGAKRVGYKDTRKCLSVCDASICSNQENPIITIGACFIRSRRKNKN